MIIVLRASSTVLNSEQIRSMLQFGGLDARWEKGEQRAGRSRQNSGVTLTLIEADDAGSALAGVRQILSVQANALGICAGAGVSLELDIGLMVPPYRPTSVVLAPALLAEAAQCNLTVRISAYPCADEEDS